MTTTVRWAAIVQRTLPTIGSRSFAGGLCARALDAGAARSPDARQRSASSKDSREQEGHALWRGGQAVRSICTCVIAPWRWRAIVWVNSRPLQALSRRHCPPRRLWETDVPFEALQTARTFVKGVPGSAPSRVHGPMKKPRCTRDARHLIGGYYPAIGRWIRAPLRATATCGNARWPVAAERWWKWPKPCGASARRGAFLRGVGSGLNAGGFAPVPPNSPGRLHRAR
jgi:hypothetical protein